MYDARPDTLVWNLTPSGNFVTKSAILLFKETQNFQAHDLWKLIWRAGILERIRTFL